MLTRHSERLAKAKPFRSDKGVGTERDEGAARVWGSARGAASEPLSPDSDDPLMRAMYHEKYLTVVSQPRTVDPDDLAAAVRELLAVLDHHIGDQLGNR